MYQKKVKKLIALGMAVLILLVLFFSQIFILTHIHHDCSGEDCPICTEIQIAEAIVQQIGSAMLTVMFLFAFVCIFTESISKVNQVTLFNTPVQMKVRMND